MQMKLDGNVTMRERNEAILLKSKKPTKLKDEAIQERDRLTTELNIPTVK